MHGRSLPLFSAPLAGLGWPSNPLPGGPRFLGEPAEPSGFVAAPCCGNGPSYWPTRLERQGWLWP